MKDLNIDTLENSWTAEVRLLNGVQISIWWTAWWSSKSTIGEVLSISSDYPRSSIKNSHSKTCVCI